MMRIALFLLTNLAVITCLLFGIILSLTGIQGRSVQGFNDHGWPIWFWWCILFLYLCQNGWHYDPLVVK